MTLEDKIKEFISDKKVVAYRKIKWNKKSKSFDKTYIDINTINIIYLRANFNTQTAGGTAIFFEKEGKEYFFGLKEFKKPPVFEES